MRMVENVLSITRIGPQASELRKVPEAVEEVVAQAATLSAGVSCPEQYVSGGLTVDFDKRLVRVDGKDIHLTQIEYKIVAFLARNPGRVMTYDAIMIHVWGPYLTEDNKILRVNMANIRRKLEKNPAEPQYIQTEIGVGYRIAEEDI